MKWCPKLSHPVSALWCWAAGFQSLINQLAAQAPVEHHIPELAAIIGIGAWMSDSSAKHGAAQISCEGGCSCRARKYHFTHPYPGLSRVSTALPHDIRHLQVAYIGISCICC